MQSTIDYDPNIFTAAAQAEQDKSLLVKFYLHAQQDKQASMEEGRPIFREIEYISIRVPGSKEGIARPVRPGDKQRFPRHYDAFKARVDMPLEGTPLSEVPWLSRAIVEELAFAELKTVEQLSTVSDQLIGQYRNGLMFKQKAQQWLESSKSGVTIEEMQRQLDSRDKMLDKLQRQLDKLMKEKDGE